MTLRLLNLLDVFLHHISRPCMSCFLKLLMYLWSRPKAIAHQGRKCLLTSQCNPYLLSSRWMMHGLIQ